MAATDSFRGILPVDKPAGPTSHDMVTRARRALRTRRIGHTGTLDPFATGLLLLCLGDATRLAEFLTGLPKQYRALMRLGVSTRTDDATGEVVASTDGWRALDEGAIREALLAQTGALLQVPPAFSAKKIGGARAYELARRGIGAELPAVPVHVHAIEPIRIEPPDVEFDVSCSAGTYIRAIARDIGKQLGVGAHLTALRRTAIGPHSVDDAVAPERLDDPDAVRAALLTPLEALQHLPRLVVGAEDMTALAHGRRLRAAPDAPHGVVVVSHDDELVAIAEIGGGVLRPRKVFAHA